MRISIYSIRDTLFDGTAERIVARTPMGEITVLDNHIPLISSLVGPGLKIITGEKKETVIPIASGFLEVRPGSEVVVLMN